jgi:flagella basal body P-ring formation protein FlgA
MRRFLVIVFLLCVLSQAITAETLEQFLTDKVIADYQLERDLIRLTLVRSALKNTDLEGLQAKAYPLTHSEPRGRFPMQVELFRDGAMIEKGSVSLDVRIFAELPVPVQNIKRHELLGAEMFEIKRFDITSITEKLLAETSQFEDCRAKQNLAAGRYVPLRRVEKIPDVENGHNVTIVGNGGMLEIRAKGIALQNGAIGETIKVKNVDSRKILMGKITAPGVVEIAI